MLWDWHEQLNGSDFATDKESLQQIWSVKSSLTTEPCNLNYRQTRGSYQLDLAKDTIDSQHWSQGCGCFRWQQDLEDKTNQNIHIRIEKRGKLELRNSNRLSCRKIRDTEHFLQKKVWIGDFLNFLANLLKNFINNHLPFKKTRKRWS